MVTASAIATIEDLSPGRLAAYFGTGFTARFTMGQASSKWADLATYIEQVRGLLRGDVVEIEGAPCQTIHSPGWAPARPINVPLGLAPIGPKGFAVSPRPRKSRIRGGPRRLSSSTVLCSTPARARPARGFWPPPVPPM
jgi:hypothetical protein